MTAPAGGLAAIQAALVKVPCLKCKAPYTSHMNIGCSFWPDWDALAALVASWVGPLEEAVHELLTELAWSAADAVAIGANDPACINVRRALTALPWRTEETR